MTPATFDGAIGKLEGQKMRRHRSDASPEERRADEEHNMMLIALYSDAQRALLDRIDTLFPDRSVGAIWRRAYKRSINISECDERAIKSRRWKARALNLNPDPLHNAIALSGMAPIQWEERWHLAVAIPQPAPTDDMGHRIEDIVLIDPEKNTAEVMGDRGATHVAPPAGLVDRLPVTTDPKAWARQIALDRLEWWRLRAERRHMVQAEPTWNGWPTTALLLVDPKKMRWSQLSASVLEVPADMRETVRRAVLAEARLPKVEGRA